MSKLLFFDLETTGVKFWRNGIHQIGGIVDIDGQEVERFDIRSAPNPAATIEQEALDVAGVTLEQVQSYQPMEEGYRQLVGILSKYVNKFDKRIKCIWWGITTLDSTTTSYGLYLPNVGISISDHGFILTVWMYMLW